MSKKFEPYFIISSQFKGVSDGQYVYEMTFNKSLGHTGRFLGIEKGLNEYCLKEIGEYEAEILKKAEEIKNRNLSNSK